MADMIKLGAEFILAIISFAFLIAGKIKKDSLSQSQTTINYFKAKLRIPFVVLYSMDIKKYYSSEPNSKPEENNTSLMGVVHFEPSTPPTNYF